MKSDTAVTDRINGSLFAGAIGDSFGAAVEFKRLPEILALTAERGVTDLMYYDPASFSDKVGPGRRHGFGVVTDDTAMLVALAAGLLAGLNQFQVIDDRALPLVQQAFLRWGQYQPWVKDRGQFQRLMDAGIEWPAWFRSFCYRTGAGMLTIASLESGRTGSWENPIVTPSVREAGKLIFGNGCGGLMRVAPVGWLGAMGLIEDPFLFGAKTAALTHGHDCAMTASGGLALLIAGLTNGLSWSQAAAQMLQRMGREPRAAESLAIAEQALARGAKLGQSLDFHEIDNFPVAIKAATAGKHRTLFTAPAVWAQVLLIGAAAQSFTLDTETNFRRALSLAVTQSGDSDSVGAIIGNVLGAGWSNAAIPAEWRGALQSGDQLSQLNGELAGLVIAMRPASVPKSNSDKLDY